MKILHTADWHVGKGRFPGQEASILNCLEWMLNEASSLHPDVILVAGDLFDKAKVWIERGARDVQQVYSLLNKLSHLAPVVALKGTPNHDGEDHFELLKELLSDNKAISFITKPETLFLKTKAGTVNIIGIPSVNYGSYRMTHSGLSKEAENQALMDELMQIIESLYLMRKTADKTVLMAHYTVSGADTESGQTMLFSENEVVLPAGKIQTMDFDLVALGHIHRPQEVSKNIFYAGGINAFNFGDEGQKRGFYIHDLKIKKSQFIVTPYQHYQTLRFKEEQIKTFIAGDYSLLPEVENKVIRIYFEAKQETLNQFSANALEQVLLTQGKAAWVSEITCEKYLDPIKTSTMSDNPLDNIKVYLEEEEDSQAILDLATPVFAKTLKTKETIRGRMIPVQLEVKNYRNYKEEIVDFSKIDFATVIGDNGSGKSSLFMDAIIDCLYEETRENDLKAWINNRESVKNGSISFEFLIGETVYRVIRTRSKKGRATLSLAKKEEGVFNDLSGDTLKETQKKIIDLVGDTTTLKSCGLIMQDAYGVFLEADKTKRMQILSGLLSLDLYEEAKESFVEKGQVAKRKIATSTRIRDDLVEKLEKEKYLDNEKKENQKNLKNFLENEKILKKELEEIKQQKILKKEIMEIENQAKQFENESEVIQNDLKKLSDSLKELSNHLLNKDKIIKNAESAREIEIKLQKIALKEEELSHFAHQKKELTDQMALLQDDKLKNQLTKLNGILDQRAVLKSKAMVYLETKKKLEKAMVVAKKAAIHQEVLFSIKNKHEQAKQAFNLDYQNRLTTYKKAKQTFSLLKKSGCKGTIACPFIEAAKKIDLNAMIFENKSWKQEKEKEINCYQEEIKKTNELLEKLKFDPDEINLLQEQLDELREDYNTYEQFKVYEEQKNDCLERLTIETKRLEIIKQNIQKIDEDCKRLEIVLNQKKELNDEYETLKKYLILEQRIDGDQREVEFKNKQLVEKEKEQELFVEKQKQLQIKCDHLKIELSKIKKREEEVLEASLNVNQENIKIAYAKEGEINLRYQEKLKKEDALKEELEMLQKLSKELTLINALKEACAYTGIPHRIIATELAVIENKANQILSQMTGGDVSIAFVTEKVVGKGNKEVPILDVVINEKTSGTLAYHSRSGGERVKISLAVALALAELKANKTGVQLGFLFIDEPPYLDESGMEAYCDSLAIISKRYKGLKVIAITHDVSMRSRFLQTIEIVKTETGSKIN